MHLMFVASECAPLAQSGGLGDAVSGLARALGSMGHRVTVIIPAYRQALASNAVPRLVDGGGMRLSFKTSYGGPFDINGRFLCGSLFPGVEVALLDMPAIFDRPGLYGDGGVDYGDNALRFIALSRAAAYRAEAEQPDVLVAHDWHGALTIAMLRTSLDRGLNRKIGTVQVVHNNAHQGRVAPENMAFTGLAPDLMHVDGLEAWDTLCMLKGGVSWADRIVAVSPTYAREIQTHDFGEGLEGAYQNRKHRLTGIVNGIDDVRFDPATDSALPAQYSAEDMSGKAVCRAKLLERTGLDAPAPGLLCAAIGRLAQQKGWDIIVRALDGLLDKGASFVALGDGAKWISDALHELAAKHPRRVFFRSAYDDVLARQIYAGADVMLVPSRFEPCGLVQLIAQRYGTVPVAHATGGLVDTIQDPWLAPTRAGTDAFDPWRRATGVLFSPLTPENLVFGVDRVAKLGARLPEIQKRLLSLDVSWDGPASSWAAVLTEVEHEAKLRL
ncbi:MAG TPA: glycogen/starch synthase [Myxococcota bacterium]|jgi:starch synthase